MSCRTARRCLWNGGVPSPRPSQQYLLQYIAVNAAVPSSGHCGSMDAILGHYPAGSMPSHRQRVQSSSFNVMQDNQWQFNVMQDSQELPGIE